MIKGIIFLYKNEPLLEKILLSVILIGWILVGVYLIYKIDY
jgi:hypothetical protein